MIVLRSAALLWWTAQSWELELFADVTAGWKQLKTTEEHVHSANLSKNTRNTRFKRRETRRIFSGVLSCTDNRTQSSTRRITQKQLLQLLHETNKQLLPVYILLIILQVKRVAVYHTTALKIHILKDDTHDRRVRDVLPTISDRSDSLLICSSQHLHACHDFYLFHSFFLVLKKKREAVLELHPRWCWWRVFCEMRDAFAERKKMFYFTVWRQNSTCLTWKLSFKLPTIICVIYGTSQSGANTGIYSFHNSPVRFNWK